MSSLGRVEQPHLPHPTASDLESPHGFDTLDRDSLEDALDARTVELLRRRRSGRAKRRGWLVRRTLAAADAAGLVLALVVAEVFYGGEAVPWDRVSPAVEVLLFVLTLPAWFLLFRAYGLYDRDEERANHTTTDDVFGVFNAVTVGTWAVFALAWLSDLADPTIRKVIVFWVAAVVFVSLGRAAARAVARRRHEYLQNTLIVGAGEVGQTIARKLLLHPEYGVNLLGFVDERPRRRRDDIGELAIAGAPAELPELVRELDVERVIVAFSDMSTEDALALVRRLNALDVQVDVVPRLFDVVGPHASVHAVEGLPLLSLPRARLSRSSMALKRALDLSLSALGLVVLSPLLVAVAVAIKLDSPGPVLFAQVRMGAGGRPFRMLKFRTMAADAEARKAELAHLNKHAAGDPRMFKVPDDPRVTRVGRLLRRTSLDELPQLWNVVRGEMSLVGPRPLVLDEHAHVEDWALRRLDLKPGITGYWQVLGRDDIPFGEMVELDYRYVTGWSLLGDLKLILRTVPALGRSRG